MGKSSGKGGSTTLNSSTSDLKKSFSFKNPTFVHSSKGGPKAKEVRVLRNMKQVITSERNLALHHDVPSYTTIDAPPSLKPTRKYADLSGLPALYTDPQTKLRYASKEEFSDIRLLPSDIVTGYLALRRAAVIM